MKTSPLKRSEQVQHLKVIKNNKSKQKNNSIKSYINTLVPNFKYTNSSGDQSSPTNHVLI